MKATIARTLAFLFGGFVIFNIVGEWLRPGFDANGWWIDLSPVHPMIQQLLLAVASVLLIAFAMWPRMSRIRRITTSLITALLAMIAAYNAVMVVVLYIQGRIDTGVPIPFSLFVSVVLAWLAWQIVRFRPERRGAYRIIVGGVTAGSFVVGFCLAQMFLFGYTDYRRPADAVVVFGARAYADGRPSDALADRVRTGCELYHRGLVKTVVFSGGPGDGSVHETESMRRMAVSLGVPNDVILVDGDGVNTQATVVNTDELFKVNHIERVIAVSHYYHLPRIKMAYQRSGREVFTVPANERYVLRQTPYLLTREVAAMVVYYLRPLLG